MNHETEKSIQAVGQSVDQLIVPQEIVSQEACNNIFPNAETVDGKIVITLPNGTQLTTPEWALEGLKPANVDWSVSESQRSFIFKGFKKADESAAA